MDDGDILRRVHDLVEEEHGLRSKLTSGEITDEEEHRRLRALEEGLDQCWDLLRQRRARRSSGQDPDGAQSRAVGEVEGYLQ